MKRAALVVLIACLPILPGCPHLFLVALPGALFTTASELDCEENHRDTHTCRDDILKGEQDHD